MAAKGKLNRQQASFAGHYAATGDAAYSATKAGYSSPAPRASQNLALEHVQEEIRRVQIARLFSEALPAAVDCLLTIIRDVKAPSGARVQAAKVVMDRTLGAEGADSRKEAHELTGEELARAIDALEREAAARAKDVTASAAPDTGILG